MKNSSKAIAVTSGVIFALGQVAVSGMHGLLGPRIVIGVIFGLGITMSMIRRPERVSGNHIAFVLAPLLTALIAWMAVYEPANLLPTILWALFFLASQVAFLWSSSTSGSAGRTSGLSK